MKIRTKLLLVYSPLLLLLIIVLIIGRTQSENFNELGETLEYNYGLTTLAVTIRRDIKDESISLRNIFIYEDESLIQRELQRIRELNKKIIENIETLTPHAYKERSMQMMADLALLTEEWQLYQRDVITAVQVGDRQEASRLMNERGTGIQDEIHQLVGELTLYLEDHMNNLLKMERENVNRTATFVSSILAILIGIIILFLLRFIWSFSSRLANVSSIMRGITSGELNLDTKVQVTGEDEIDFVANSFNRMTASLEENTKHLEDRNEKLLDTKSELEEKAKELELSSKYKSEFLANMSHELRTPLNSMIILSRLLAENKEATLTEKQREYAQTIHTSTNSLHDIINDILDLSKIEYGNMKIDPVYARVHSIAREMEMHFKHVAMEKGIGFAVTVAEDVPEKIFTDDMKLKQVLRNLISNAIKFTSEGHVNLEISLAEGAADENPMLKFAVTDTGIGISNENQGLVFQAFQQEDAGTSRKYGGTGLGLSITKELVTLLQGEITLESERGKGSTFSVYLSNYDVESDEVVDTVVEDAKQVFQTVKAARGETVNDSLVGKRVMLVDDNIDHIIKILGILEAQGMMIEFTANREEALEQFENDTRLDFVFIYADYLLENGVEIIGDIRDIPAYKDIPILTIVNAEQQEEINFILEAGTTDYIRRPIEVEQLNELMQKYL